MKTYEADFTYTIKNNTIEIIDLNLGNKSVTNDIENVIRKIATEQNIDPHDYKIIYKDSEGDWTEVRIINNIIEYHPIDYE